jgi:hypothetical protein
MQSLVRVPINKRIRINAETSFQPWHIIIRLWGIHSDGSRDGLELCKQTTTVFQHALCTERTSFHWAGAICVTFLRSIHQMHGKLNFTDYLDEETLESARTSGLKDLPGSSTEVKRMMTDYLRLLYGHIESRLELDLEVRWTDAIIEFRFSIPPSWTNTKSQEEFLSAIHEAGFGTKGRRHTALIDLTDAESICAHTLSVIPGIFTIGDVILVCYDTGTGMDLAIVEIIGKENNVPVIGQVVPGPSTKLSQTAIDRAFDLLVNAKLARFPDVRAMLPENFASWMASSKEFRNFAAELGIPGEPDMVAISIKGLPRNFSYGALQIWSGEMRFLRLVPHRPKVAKSNTV